MTEKSDEQKKPRLELKKTFDAGKIKQSFSHGRSRSVAVEVKRKSTLSGLKTEEKKRQCHATPRHHAQPRIAVLA